MKKQPDPLRLTRGVLRRRAALLDEIVSALNNGQTLLWGDGVRVTRTRQLREMGIELVTETSAKRRGHRIKQRQTPIAIGYYKAPLQRYADLYIAGVQTRPERDGEP